MINSKELYMAPTIRTHQLHASVLLQSSGEKTIRFDTTVNPDYNDPDDERILNL